MEAPAVQAESSPPVVMPVHESNERKNLPIRIGLFIPCYVDAFFPEVGIATLELT